MRITNYRRFIAMSLLCSCLIFLLGWGVVYLVEKVMTREDTEKADTVELVSPENADSPYLIIVNANYPLDSTYEPTDLTVISLPSDTTLMMSAEAANAINTLYNDAVASGIDLKGVSAYRSYLDQQILCEAEENVSGNTTGVESAEPGTSEHQTGLAVDVSSADVNYALSSDFGETPAGEWLRNNVANYGFIIRYPQGKEVVTGNIYEPWHLRYVGIEDARKIMEHNLSLEEYMQKLSGVLKNESSSNTTKTDD